MWAKASIFRIGPFWAGAVAALLSSRAERMGIEDLRPAYLSGPSVYLRAMVEDDKERTAAWLDETFPANAGRGEKALTEEHGSAVPRRQQQRLAIALNDGNEVVGSVRVYTRDRRRTCFIAFDMARWREDRDALRGEALGIVVHWLRDETEAMTVTVEVPADQRATIAAAEAAGMVRAATLREWYARPGGRVDCLFFQALNPHWEAPDA
jgi:RimJ/RimL family protein N-acetyltransferase